MTELEAQLLTMLEAEKKEQEQERGELAAMLQSIAKQQQQIIELLQKPTEGDSLEATLQKVLNSFQHSLTESLTASLEASISTLIESSK